MPFTPISFESSRVKEAERNDIREARENVLSRAKDAYDRRQQKAEDARRRGDDKWMLPSVEARLLDSDKSKKSKKHKKHKKKKSKKKSKKHSSSESSSSETEDEWVEKPGKSSSLAQPSGAAVDVKISLDTAKVERDEWMSLPGLIPCVSRNELKKVNKEKLEAEEKQKFMLDRPGQSAQELNPYWRDGGSGLPGVHEIEEELHLPQKAVGDQGSGWLRKALQRVHEQAAETGQSAEAVAAERWGSLKKLEKLLAEAEGRKRRPQESQRNDSSRRPSSSRDRDHNEGQKYEDGRREKPRFARPSDDYEDATYKRTSRDDFHKARDDYDSQRKSDSRERRRYEKPQDSSRDRTKPRFEKPSDEFETKSEKSSGKTVANSSKSDSYYHDKKKDEKFFNEFAREKEAGNKKHPKQTFHRPRDDDYDKPPHQRASSSSGSKNWQKKEAKPEPTPPPKQRKPPSSSSSSESSETEEMQEEEPPKLLSDKEMNDIGAKIVKAEILGNEQLAKELKQQLETARKARDEAKNVKAASSTSQQEEEVVILTRTNARGMTRPLETPQYQEPSGGRRKKQKVETHNKAGQRERYFPDDDKYRLQDMFTKEKMNTVEDSNNEFAKIISKGAARAGSGEYDLDDMFEEKARFKESDGKMQARDREQAMREHHRVTRALEGCRWCLDSKQMLKHLIIAIGTKVYLSLPPYQSLTPGHCLLAPTMHSPCATQLDEDVWAEMQTFRKTLTRMFAAMDQDVVFFETARNLRGFPHMILECVPLDRESGNLAPIYFKKAIQECEMEWSTNKKLVELAGKGVRRSIPKGLPYFAVCFGDDDGFGHVIEEERDFPNNFAQEIIGGILDLDHQLWRKRHNENFEVQRKKVLQFAKDWEQYDFTQKKKIQSPTTSDSDTD